MATKPDPEMQIFQEELLESVRQMKQGRAARTTEVPLTLMTCEEMRAAPRRTDRARLQRELEADPVALAETRAIGALIERIERKSASAP